MLIRITVFATKITYSVVLIEKNAANEMGFYFSPPNWFSSCSTVGSRLLNLEGKTCVNSYSLISFSSYLLRYFLRKIPLSPEGGTIAYRTSACLSTIVPPSGVRGTVDGAKNIALIFIRNLKQCFFDVFGF